MYKKNKKLLYFSLLMSFNIILFGCGKEEPKSNEVILGNSSASNIYNNTNKEDNNFNKFEEKNGYSSEMTNTTELDVIKTKDKLLPTGDANSSSANVSNGNNNSDKMTPEEADKAIIEEEYECDYIKYGEKIFYIPLTKGFKLANESNTFKPEIGDGVTTLTTNDKNTAILTIRIIEEKNEDYYWNYLDDTFNELSTNNNISGLKQTPWKEEISYDYSINYSGLYWNEVMNANVTYYGWEICWLNLGDVTLFAELKTNNENEKVSIENVAKEMYPAIIYLNKIAEIDNTYAEDILNGEENVDNIENTNTTKDDKNNKENNN